LGILFLKGTHGCATSVTGATWKFTWGVDVEIQGVETVELCSELCREDASCHGYTWLTNGVVSYCYKFKSLDGMHVCEGCSSGTFPENLTGACAGSVEDVLDSGATETFEDCEQFCHDTLGCNVYTWYDQSTPFSRSCFLYESCTEEIPCTGCSTGRINCISSPQCFEYHILNEESRSTIKYEPESHTRFCDSYGNVDMSGMWKGKGFYRFMEPSGTMMPEVSPGFWHCGTAIPGWLNNHHPEEVGLEVEMKACFDNGSGCDYSTNITVTKCNDYYVYHLVEVVNDNALRYCATMEN
jgi:hypothetical protein